MKIVIIGAGISGLLSAYYLLKCGHTVEILESESAVASKATGANASQLSYTYVNPIASPTLIKMLPHIILGRNSGMKIGKFDIATFLWCLKLIRQATSNNFSSNRTKLLKLSLASKSLFEEIISETKIIFKKHSKGKVQVFHSEQLVQSANDFAKQLAAAGITQDSFGANESDQFLRGFKIDDSFISGAYSAIDESADCISFCKDLIEHLKQSKNFTIKFNTRLKTWGIKENLITHIETSDNNLLQDDAFLLCTGSQTNKVTKTLGISFPIVPVKGYTLVYNYKSELKYSITDHKNKIVFVPQDDQTIVSGMFHIDGSKETIDKKTAQHIHERAVSRIPALSNVPYDIRCGLRPCTPDSVPIVSNTKFGNLFINAGHGMFGWTLSASCAKKIADIIHSETHT